MIHRPITNLVVTGNDSNGYDVFTNTFTTTGIQATVTISGLIPGETYNFNIGAEFSVGSEYGFSTTTIGGLETLDDCFTGINISTAGHSTDFSCDSGTLNFSVANENNDDLSAFLVAGTMTQVISENDNTPISSSLPLPSVPAFDWNEDNQGNLTGGIHLPNLSPGACYQVILNFVDALGNVYGPEGEQDIVYTFCVPTNCGSGPGVFSPDQITCMSCDEFCFQPITAPDGVCVEEYRLEISDQEGNTEEFYLRFDCNQISTTDCGGFCYDLTAPENLTKLANLGYPPYVAQLVSIYNFEATNGTQFDFDLCCTDGEISPELMMNYSCYRNEVYVSFCLDNLISCFAPADIEIEADGGNMLFDPASLLEGDGWDGEKYCYMLKFNIFGQDKPFCQDLRFRIRITSGDRVFFIDDVVPLSEQACCGVDDDGGPVGDPTSDPDRDRPMKLQMYANNDDGSMHIIGKVPEYSELIKESRKEGSLPRYTLLDKAGQVMDYQKYSNRLNLKLPEAYKTSKQLNENYTVHLLLSNTYYAVPFPELEAVNEDIDYEIIFGSNTTSDVLVFPNPTQGKVTIKLKNELVIESLALYDTEGKEYLNKVIMNNQITLDLANYPDGLYFVEIIDTKGNILKEKIVLSN